MGLAEKRLAKQIQEQDIPAFQSEIRNLTGFEPQLEILWDTFTAFDEYPLTRLQNDILPGLVEVLQSICRDDMGKEALAGTLNTIRLENTDDSDRVTLTFEAGVLFHKMQLAGDTYSRYSVAQIIELLEQTL
ncbi:MAG TPA: hypothetical protein PKD70_02300 [Saprospiraceae bacterium]|nr:hypothetical protein [Saprospiraceae bacterium]HMP12683.1 hypothetical protein [Saprospiraceae bacterium]